MLVLLALALEPLLLGGGGGGIWVDVEEGVAEPELRGEEVEFIGVAGVMVVVATGSEKVVLIKGEETTGADREEDLEFEFIDSAILRVTRFLREAFRAGGGGGLEDDDW